MPRNAIAAIQGKFQDSILQFQKIVQMMRGNDVVKKEVFYVDPMQSRPETDLEQLLKIYVC